MDLPRSIVVDGVLKSPLAFEESKEILLDRSFPEFVLKMVEENLERNGDKNVLVNADLALRNLAHDNLSQQRLLLSEIVPKARKAAKAFHYHLNLQPKDIVQISLPNTTEYFIPILATWLLQGITSLVNPLLQDQSCSQRLEDTKPKFVVCCESNIEDITESLKSLNKLDETKIVLMDFDSKEDRDHNIYSFYSMLKDCDDFPDIPVNKEVDLNDVIALVWSSGTTGRSKAVKKTHRSICSIKDFFDGKMLLTTHFFHNSGIVISLRSMMNSSTTYFFPSASLTQEATLKVFKAIDRYKIDMLGPRGTLCMELCNEDKAPEGLDLSSIKQVFPIGTNIVGDTFGSLKRLFPNLVAVPNIYTLTEFGGLISSSDSTDKLGNIPPGTLVKIIDPETGKICGPNEVGEIQAKCSLITPGYHNRPEEDAKLFAEDGFMRTGDLGHYDDNAVLYFNGRADEVIKFKGTRIYPNEIEDVIARIPGVKEVGVFGRSDPAQSELTTALVVKKEGAKLTENEVREVVQRELEDFKRLHGGVCLVEELPKNAMGKMVRKSFQEVYDNIRSRMRA